jgi:glycosidase
MVYNSRNTKYKTPFGAVCANREFTINFPIAEYILVEEGYMILENGEIVYYPLAFSYAENGINYFSAKINIKKEGIYWYHFKFKTSVGVLYFCADEFNNAIPSTKINNWQLTVHSEDYATPKHLKGGVIYHIFADRFCRNGINKTERNYRIHENWDESPEIVSPDGKYYADDFFGGNIKGIIEKLPYIKSLGTTIIYLSPIFEAQSNHRYDTGDFMKIDPLFGTETEFKQLIKEAKELGMEIMFDGVFNHTGADSIYFNKFGTYEGKGAYQGKESPYYDWFTFQKFPDEYTCWWGCTNVPTVVHLNPDYQKLIFGKKGVLEKWTKLGVKGWRLDVVDELPIEFVDKIRKVVKSIDEEAVIIGEVWEDASTKVSYGIQRPYLNGCQLDGVMNYPFKNSIISFVYTNKINKFKNEVWSILENYPKQSIDCCMTIIGTHDTVRAINIFSGVDMSNTTKKQRQDKVLTSEEYNLAKSRLKIAALLQFTLPGIPSIFYGDEVGVQGYEDPINRRTYPWGNED